MKSIDATARIFDDRGANNLGTIVATPIEGSSESFSVSLWVSGRLTDLGVVQQKRGGERAYAVLAKAFARAAVSA